MPARISLVFLTLNEVEGVKALLPHLSDPARLSVDEVFAVDGGSTDGTLDQYARHGVRVLQQRSRGRGEAIRLAAERADSDYLVYFSPDGNEDWRDIPRFRALFEQGFDFVIGSRMMKGAYNEEDSTWFRPRKWANNAFNWAANVLFNRDRGYVTDSINGFRGIRRNVLLGLGLDATGFTIEYQMTIRAMQHGVKIAEFPTHESSRIAGTTKASSIPTGLHFLKCLWDELRSRRSRKAVPQAR